MYHLLGVISSLLFLLTWYGLARQWWEIERRRRQHLPATQSLSVNQFASSYFGFYANFIFGIAIDPFNHYLVWTRCGALILLLAILWRIWQERRHSRTLWVTSLASLAFVAGGISMGFRPYPALASMAANGMMLVVTVILVQGTLHQYWVLNRTGEVGALSASLFRSILIKDISTLMFGLTMPIVQAWPLLVLNGASVLSRGMLYLRIRQLQRLKPV